MALNGDLTDLSLPDLLYIFHLRGLTGRLTLQSDHDDALLHFQRGKLVFVTSSRVSQHLGQLLLRTGRLTLDQLGMALAMQATTHASQTLGDILVGQSWLAHDDLNTALTCQAEEVLFRVLAWAAGNFSFTATPTAPLTIPLRDLNIEQIILEATRRADELAAVHSRIPSLDCRVLLTNDPASAPLSGTLRLKARIIIASIMEGAATLRAVAQATGLDEGEVMRIAYELVNHDLLAISSPAAPGGPEPAALVAQAATLGGHRGLLSPRRATTASMLVP